MSEVVRKNIKDSALFAALDENLHAIVEISGSSERLFSTPIPTSYTSHTSRFLTVWALLLPFGARLSGHDLLRNLSRLHAESSTGTAHVTVPSSPSAGMWNEMRWFAVLFAPLMAYLLFAIDEIGVQLVRESYMAAAAARSVSLAKLTSLTHAALALVGGALLDPPDGSARGEAQGGARGAAGGWRGGA